MPETTASATTANSASSPQEAWDAMSLLQQRAAVFRVQGLRETAEAFVVAFVLALLFRTFIAEAFVIPTGSMAPALMGAHKDVFCPECGQEFPIGASLENRSAAIENVVVGGVCPNCRHVYPLDLENNPEDATFSGDRILVSKFAYALSDPERWDVIVFKVPINPKQNYIKRLVGLPNETLTLMHGDVYALPGTPGEDAEPMVSRTGDPIGEILRKPPEKLLAMKSMVYDSNHQPSALVEAGYPARLQPWRPGVSSPPSDSWTVERSADGLLARVEASAETPQWLRYYHHWPTSEQWDDADNSLSLAGVDPYLGRLITDFYAYDAYLFVDADRVYDIKPSPSGVSPLQRLLGNSRGGGVFRPSYDSGGNLDQFRNHLQYGTSGYAGDGAHWVGDLIVEADVETAAGTQVLTMEIVEAGVQYRCNFDLKTGQASLSINDGQPRSFDAVAGSQNLNPIAETDVRAGSRHKLRFSNCDDELVLWVDDEVVAFETPATFDVSQFLKPEQVRPVYNGPGDPRDASPVGIAVRGGEATLHRMTIDRDKYYIATQNGNQMLDYDMSAINEFADATVRVEEIQAVMAEPKVWKDFPGWASRRRVSFPIGEDQFFPMGDNSPESLDARCWAGTKTRYGRDRSVDPDSYLFADAAFVPRDLLVGKALAIFWPHPWPTPVPFTPNFERMRLIK
ncbi:signal peptidase I [Allorhodopirellula solitaria]|uniref:Signal peptidase I n=1 Tax=Allorhodopirellula solitaria TaxID=2527987 RepID=A0A5C5YJM3_9BACT|nr:signal peptidase I [Allorhodopirellula solitaria]TWT75019.1 Signal peptidase I [Allorhodopirellula solitaria]